MNYPNIFIENLNLCIIYKSSGFINYYGSLISINMNKHDLDQKTAKCHTDISNNFEGKDLKLEQN